jgi:hypothetical protein
MDEVLVNKIKVYRENSNSKLKTQKHQHFIYLVLRESKIGSLEIVI